MANSATFLSNILLMKLILRDVVYKIRNWEGG